MASGLGRVCDSSVGDSHAMGSHVGLVSYPGEGDEVALEALESGDGWPHQGGWGHHSDRLGGVEAHAAAPTLLVEVHAAKWTSIILSIIIKKKLDMHGRERAIDILSVRRPQPHNNTQGVLAKVATRFSLLLWLVFHRRRRLGLS